MHSCCIRVVWRAKSLLGTYQQQPTPLSSKTNAPTTTISPTEPTMFKIPSAYWARSTFSREISAVLITILAAMLICKTLALLNIFDFIHFLDYQHHEIFWTPFPMAVCIIEAGATIALVWLWKWELNRRIACGETREDIVTDAKNEWKVV